jgi:hypothetical protein
VKCAVLLISPIEINFIYIVTFFTLEESLLSFNPISHKLQLRGVYQGNSSFQYYKVDLPEIPETEY